MENTIVFALTAVVVAWVVLFLVIRHWGPRAVRRLLFCPEKKAPAHVTFERREGSFGSLKARDVKECSLFPDAPVTCDKQCLG